MHYDAQSLEKLLFRRLDDASIQKEYILRHQYKLVFYALPRLYSIGPTTVRTYEHISWNMNNSYHVVLHIVPARTCHRPPYPNLSWMVDGVSANNKAS